MTQFERDVEFLYDEGSDDSMTQALIRNLIDEYWELQASVASQRADAAREALETAATGLDALRKAIFLKSDYWGGYCAAADDAADLVRSLIPSTSPEPTDA